MNLKAVQCLHCRQPLPDPALGAGTTPCPFCQRSMRTILYPSLFRNKDRQTDTSQLVEGESSCFFHQNKKAVVACSSCGRFLCQLCDVEIESRSICPSCIDSQMSKGQLDALERSRFLHHKLCLALAGLNILIGFCTLGIPGLFSIFFGVRALFAPASVYQNSRVPNRVWATLGLVISVFSTFLILYFLIKSFNA